MRIKLQEGKQHELIKRAKRRWRYTWIALAKTLGVSGVYLRNELRNEIRTLPSQIYEKLCKLIGEDYHKFIKEKLPSNWGQMKGGLLAPPPRPRKPRVLARPSEDLAEIMGLMLGDGSVYINPRYGAYTIRICGHSHLDREYLLGFVSSIFERTFGIKLNYREHKNRKELFAYKQSKDLVHTLMIYGFPPGNKKKNNVGIPNWIMKNSKFLRACIRGLVDTDGSIYPRTRMHQVPSIWFKSSILALRRDFRQSLLQLGFHPTKWTSAISGFNGGSGSTQCSLARAEEVIRFYREIEFNNPKTSQTIL